MILPDDVMSLTRILGIPEEKFPAKLVEEYGIRQKMFCADGHSGTLGTIGLIDLVRSLGLSSAAAAPAPVGDVDWRRYPQNYSVRVETLSFGQWIGGYFGGFGPSGTIMVRVDYDDFVREIHKSNVRIALDQTPPPADVSDSLSEADPSEVFADDDDEPDPSKIDWSRIDEGTPIYIDEDGAKEGRFIRLGAEGPRGQQLLIHIDGEDCPREVLEEEVLYNGEPSTLAGAVTS